MRRIGVVGCTLVIVGLLGLCPSLQSQTGATGTIVGSVTDPTGAHIADAKVDLFNSATGLKLHADANSSGQFSFPSLPPGIYSATVSSPGFQTVIVQVRVEVAKSVLANIHMVVGPVAQTVEVISTAQVDLQTTDSSVGGVVGSAELTRLPTSQRNATQLALLQVATISGAGSNGYGGAVAGARPDSNSATFEGIDVTDQYLGGVNSGTAGAGLQLPVDAVEEFRGVVSNSSADLTRSAGGQFTYTSRRGTDNWHGAGYWYHQNSAANANTWDLDRLGQPKPKLIDNRVGARVGGPVQKGKTYLFGFYESRRFPRAITDRRLVPSDNLRNGVLTFRDATGTARQYNLATSTLCGPTNSTACDPRGLGISPLVVKDFALYPKANATSGNSTLSGSGAADGLNTLIYSGNTPTAIKHDFALTRIDHNISNKWRTFGSFFYQHLVSPSNAQVDMDVNVTGGSGFKSLAADRAEPRNLVFGLTGEISPRLVNEFRFGWTQLNFRTGNTLPSAKIGSGTAIELAGGLLDDPGDSNVLNGPQIANSQLFDFIDNVTLTRGTHMIRAGATIQWNKFYHSRTDRSGSGLVVPVASLGSTGVLAIPTTMRPPTCGTNGAAPQVNCLLSADVSRWNALAAATLGMWESTKTFVAFAPDGTAHPGDPTVSDNRWWHTEYYGADTWRITPSLTLNYGLNFLFETPVKDQNGLDHTLIDNGTGKPINPQELLKAKADAAAKGQVVNPQIAYTLASNVGGTRYPNQFKVGPRVGLAWNPGFENGILGSVFGNRKTALRGGYSRVYDRIIAVQVVAGAMTGNEILGRGAQVTTPINGSGQPFRVGVDGAAFGPTTPAKPTIPFVPQGLSSIRYIDPDLTVARMDAFDLTVQRELPGNMLFEVGYIGRFGRDLPQMINANAVPVNILDMSGKSTQTFAQAFDALAGQLRSGTAPAGVIAQPWFENNLGAGGTVNVATRATSSIVSGALSTVFRGAIDPLLIAAGKAPIRNQQFDGFRSYGNYGWSNYNGLFVILNKRPSHGLAFTVNYTWSHALDTAGDVGNFLGGFLLNPYKPGFDYSDSLYDRRHVLNWYGTYDLPLARSNKWLGGWYTSHIFTAWTGKPLIIQQSADEFAGVVTAAVTTDTVPYSGSASTATGVNRGVTGSGGIGVAGNPATGGTGLNLFKDPKAVYDGLRYFQLSSDTRSNRGVFRALGFWNVDLSVGKRTRLTERVSANVSFDFFNVFNHPNMATPNSLGVPVISFLSPASFGVISNSAAGGGRGDDAGPRRIQGGLRLEF